MQVPVLEVGGTHVSAALVDPDGWRVTVSHRFPLDADGSAAALLEAFRSAAGSVPAPTGVAWGIAMPDPFDYVTGVGSFAGVAKFGALDGVDVRAALRPALGETVFVNDADAFALGEWTAGAAVGAARVVGITLGTGVGSGWLVDGAVADPGTPPGGRIHLMQVDGQPLEDVVSRRAIRRAYAAEGGARSADVRQIAELARAGDGVAGRILDAAFTALGSVVGSCVRAFGADVLVLGGSMAASWDLFERPVRRGAGVRPGGAPDVRLARDSDQSPLIGAAVHAARSTE